MLKWLYNLAPLLLVKWLARRHCERVTYGGESWAIALSDVMVRIRGRQRTGSDCTSTSKQFAGSVGLQGSNSVSDAVTPLPSRYEGKRL